MKAKCNNCNKELDIDDQTKPVHQTDKVKVYDVNKCCLGFKSYQKIEVKEPDEVEFNKSIHFKCKICGKTKDVARKSAVVYKNGVSLCCNKGKESYDVSGHESYTYESKDDIRYRDDLYDSYSNAWNTKDNEDDE